MNTRKIISEVIDEYLTKNATDARKTVQDSFYRRDLNHLIKNQWLVHFTTLKNAMSILKNGFKGYDEIYFATTFFADKDYGGALAFAFPLDRSGDEFNKMVGILKTSSSNNALVIFQANGFENTYEPDGFNEVLFDTRSVHNCFIVMKNFRNGEFNNQYSIILKNGRIINIKDDAFLSNNRLFKWIENNYDTYRKSISIDTNDYTNSLYKTDTMSDSLYDDDNNMG